MRNYPERKDLFDTMFDDVFASPLLRNDTLMKTDIRKKDGSYVLDIEMPGFNKEDITISLYNGNLTIRAQHTAANEEKDSKGTLVRQERYSGACERTWYVGTAIRDTDVKASYENGILQVTVPTPEKKEAEEKKFIDIL
jgi:HSP20 family molecular chaperone IbpA